MMLTHLYFQKAMMIFIENEDLGCIHFSTSDGDGCLCFRLSIFVAEK